MHILVLGATGRTGSIVASKAIGRGHQVTAIVRDKRKGTLPGVKFIEGFPTDGPLLNNTLPGIDAVVVSLNINRSSDNPFARVVSPLTLISDTVNTLIPAMEQNSVRRIITVSASGVGDSWKDMPLIARLFLRYSNIWKAYQDHHRQEQLLMKSNLAWTIVRPVMLNNKETENYQASIGKPKGSGISRAGVAKFILDAIESEKYARECVTLSS